MKHKRFTNNNIGIRDIVPEGEMPDTQVGR